MLQLFERYVLIFHKETRCLPATLYLQIFKLISIFVFFVMINNVLNYTLLKNQSYFDILLFPHYTIQIK